MSLKKSILLSVLGWVLMALIWLGSFYLMGADPLGGGKDLRVYWVIISIYSAIYIPLAGGLVYVLQKERAANSSE